MSNKILVNGSDNKDELRKQLHKFDPNLTKHENLTF